MTRREIEKTFLQMGKLMKEIMAEFAPNANHISIDIVDGTIMVNAHEYDRKAQDIIERGILNARLFKDGSARIDGEYIKAKEDVA